MRSENRNLRAAARGSSRGNEQTAARAHILRELILQQGRQRVEIGEQDESVVGRLAVGGFRDIDRLEDKGGLRSRRECGANVERGPAVGVVMDQQNFLRV